MFEIYKDKSKRQQCWRWRFVNPKNRKEIFAKSEEPFALRRNCERSIKLIQKGNWTRETFVSSKTNKIHWAIKAKNGKKLGMSPHGDVSMVSLESDWRWFRRRFAKAIMILSEND